MAAKARSLVKVNSFGAIWLEHSSAEKRRVKLISGVAFHFFGNGNRAMLFRYKTQKSRGRRFKSDRAHLFSKSI